MRYTTKELELFDLFALVLAGLGLLFLTEGAFGLATGGPGSVAVTGGRSAPGRRGAKPVEVVSGALRTRAPLLTGTAFLALGAGARRVARNRGEDVADLPCVPAADREGARR